MRESPYERIDRLEAWGFVGLIVAAFSPIVADVASGWVGLAMFIGGLSIVIVSMVAMGQHE